jgi:hypothetical protein
VPIPDGPTVIHFCQHFRPDIAGVDMFDRVG